VVQFLLVQWAKLSSPGFFFYCVLRFDPGLGPNFESATAGDTLTMTSSGGSVKLRQLNKNSPHKFLDKPKTDEIHGDEMDSRQLSMEAK
jgi:hypothetical protein